MKDTLTKALTHRQFLKMCGLAIAGAGASQLVTPPRPALAYNYTTLTVSDKIGVGTEAPIEQIEVANTAGARFIVSNAGGASRKAVLIQSPGTACAYGRLLAHDYGAGGPMALVLQDNGGSVGVGTTSPGSGTGTVPIRLDISEGGIRLGGSVGNHIVSRGPNFVLNKQDATGVFVWRKNAAAGDPSTYTDLMVLDNVGRLGIGTSNPSQMLEVSGVSEPLIQVTHTGMTGNPFLLMGMNAGNNAAIFQASNGKDFKFYNGQYALTILGSNGNVGIGTTSPGDRFQVAGNIRLNGELWVNSALAINSSGVATQAFYTQ